MNRDESSGIEVAPTKNSKGAKAAGVLGGVALEPTSWDRFNGIDQQQRTPRHSVEVGKGRAAPPLSGGKPKARAFGLQEMT